MLKRLIEVALPLKEVSAQSAREKSIRHGNISTLHIWWARRPLAACRAAVFASLIPDPDDPECPESFRKLVMELLKHERYRPNGGGNGKPTEDTPRNRTLEFIKHLVRWENSNSPEFIDPARKLIASAHKFLHPGAEGDVPKVLDPFAGGGAIPLEALRLGCESHAVELNPVAHLIELCTLVYPQKYGQPKSRPLPDYIKRLITHNRAKKKAKGEDDLFDKHGPSVAVAVGEVVPNVEISDAEYHKNPLAADVKYWGHWVIERCRRELLSFFPDDANGDMPIAYIWARTVQCSNPTCGLSIPMVKQFWLCNKAKKKIAIRLHVPKENNTCSFDIVRDKEIDFDPSIGTSQDGRTACPRCQTVITGSELRAKGISGRLGQQLMAVVTLTPKSSGKKYRPASVSDLANYIEAEASLKLRKSAPDWPTVPDEPIPPDRPSPNS